MFRQSSRMTTEEAQQRYVAKLKEAQDWLKKEGIEYRALGSVATSAYIDPPGTCSLSFDRKGAHGAYQRMPDVDIVVPMADYMRVKAYRNQLERDDDFPIGIEILPSVCHFDFRPNEEVSLITHRDLFTPFPARLFDPVVVDFLGEELVTVDPLTLYHTYVTLGGVLRDKDIPRILALGRGMRDGVIKSKFTRRDMDPFHDFLAERSRLYPSYRRYRIAANWIRYRIPSRIHYASVFYLRLLQPVFFGTKGRPR